MPESPFMGTPRPQPKPNPGFVKKWMQAVREEDARVLARLREEIGPDGDLTAAYRRWYEEQMRKHTEGLIQLVTNLHRAKRNQDGVSGEE